MTRTADGAEGAVLVDGDERALLPFLPLLYVAWSDGDLTADEVDRLRALIHGHDDLGPEQRERLERWLDPAAPPSPQALAHLLVLVRRAVAALPASERTSLAALGLELARGAAASGTAAALAEIEAALGPLGREALRELTGGPAVGRDGAPEPPFDVRALTRLLDGEYRAARAALRARLREPKFRYRYGIGSDAYRELVLDWARDLAADGFGAAAFPGAYGGAGDVGRFLAIFETLATHDHSLVVKFGVQFGLFGGSIALLGTERHHRRYLRDVGTLALPGCFAMSELGHGSNVRDILTEARYDRDTGEFVIHTPSEAARKEWIGNAACHGRLATVFAQLVLDDDRLGVHAFLVPIRADDGSTMPGVRIADGGEKAGLNGVDNGRLWFDRVRIPRENLLNRYGDVSADGVYTSPISSGSRRFFTMLGTLVGGRLSVAASALSAAKSGLAIAVRYGARRRQFGPAGRAEMPILDYLSHQRRLMPALASAYALDMALKHVVQRFLDRSERDEREVEVLAAGIKAYTTWQAGATLQQCRECCGGQGYLAVNRIAVLRADIDVTTTFEGDNTVLMQLVARGLLTGYRQQFGSMRLGGTLRFLTRRATRTLAELNPIVTRQTDERHLRDPEFHLRTFRYREERLLASAAARLRRRIDEGADSFDAFNACQDHLLALASAHVERVVLEQIRAAVVREADAGLRAVLGRLAELFALARLEADEGWFLRSGVFESGKAKAIREQVTLLSGLLREDAVALVDAFGIPDELLAAPIAFSAEPESVS